MRDWHQIVHRFSRSGGTWSGRLGMVWLVLGLALGGSAWGVRSTAAAEPLRTIDLWSTNAPGETTRDMGTAMPRRPNENPPSTRITGITCPQLELYAPAEKLRNGAAVVILPGGGYNYVVRDKEGSEAAEWLNSFGVTAFVLRYRTRLPKGQEETDPVWKRPLQDGQRALRLIRSQAETLQLDAKKIGVMGFSAGGQAAALIATRFGEPAYPAGDAADRLSCRPDFAVLVYPFQLNDAAGEGLIDAVRVTAETPPTCLIHTHDDGAASSLGSVFFYAELKRRKIPAELHIFQTGGHAYGLRPTPNTYTQTWPDRARDWLSAIVK